MKFEKLYTFKGDVELFNNETKGHVINVLGRNGTIYINEYACNVLELRKALEAYSDDDLVEFIGSNDIDSDYPPNTDTRGINIVLLQAVSQEEKEEAEKRKAEEQKAKEDAINNAKLRKEAEEHKEYLRLKEKFEK